MEPINQENQICDKEIVATLLKSKESGYDCGLPKQFYCKVIDVYDGDTFTAAVAVPTHVKCCCGKCECGTESAMAIAQFQIRMYGYDAPEMKPPLKQEFRENIIENAKKARDFLSSLILGKVVLAKRIPKPKHDDVFMKDKYGRILVHVYNIDENTGKISKDSINETMLQKQYGYHYYGGTKKTGIE